MRLSNRWRRCDGNDPNHKELYTWSRWTARRKAAVVEAVHSSRITIEEVCRRYTLSVEEFLSWHNTIQRHGVEGLQINKLQNYRYARPKR